MLRDVSFSVEPGEIVCLLGPSGCGKTTLLRIIAGLEKADAGSVTYDGQDLAQVPVYRRGFGLMFQDFALFPHKNVAENVAFGLYMTGASAARPSSVAIQARVHEVLALVNLAGYEKRRVYELSGGEQQRVALARSLAPHPRLLMLDEPLGSLDRTLREELMTELRRILKQVSVTALYVTHDQQEAFAIADRVIILNAGRVEQVGTPLAVYRRPASRFVAHFLGMHNLLAGQVLSNDTATVVATSLGALHCADQDQALEPGEAVTVLLRPDAGSLVLPGQPATFPDNTIHGALHSTSFRGSRVQVGLTCGLDIPLVFELSGAAADDLPRPGQTVHLHLDPEGIALLPAEAAMGSA